MRKLFAVLTITVAFIAAPAAQASERGPTSAESAQQIHSMLRWDRHCLIGTLDGTYHDGAYIDLNGAYHSDREVCAFDMADQVYRASVLSRTAKTAKARKVFASVAQQVNALRDEAQFGDRVAAARGLRLAAAKLRPLFAR